MIPSSKLAQCSVELVNLRCQKCIAFLTQNPLLFAKCPFCFRTITVIITLKLYLSSCDLQMLKKIHILENKDLWNNFFDERCRLDSAKCFMNTYFIFIALKKLNINCFNSSKITGFYLSVWSKLFCLKICIISSIRRLVFLAMQTWLTNEMVMWHTPFQKHLAKWELGRVVMLLMVATLCQ